MESSVKTHARTFLQYLNGLEVATSLTESKLDWLNCISPSKRPLQSQDHYLHPETSQSQLSPCSAFIINWLGTIEAPLRTPVSSSRSERSQSAPPTMATPDLDGQFVRPSVPASAVSRSFAPFTASQTDSTTQSTSQGFRTSGGKSLVKQANYRKNLQLNGISWVDNDQEAPEAVASLIKTIEGRRESPGPDPNDIRHDRALEALERGTNEAGVEQYFRANIFFNPEPASVLKCSVRMPMDKNAVPQRMPEYPLGRPKPDLLYGYKEEAFSKDQLVALDGISSHQSPNAASLQFPFLVIEFEGDAPRISSHLWASTNKILGGSATCVNIADQLSEQLRACGGAKLFDNVVFSIVMSGTEARIFISWKHDELQYYTKKLQTFMLQKPGDFVAFRSYVRNILDWGRDQRFNEIQELLEVLLEEDRKAASQQAKTRAPAEVHHLESESSGRAKRRRIAVEEDE